jgi:molybdate transport system substrate-binding protein
VRARILALGLVAIAIATGSALAGCGGGDNGPELTVGAASSLTTAFTNYGDEFTAADVKYSFAGSDDIEAQIRQGVNPDVFASANTDLPDGLYRDGLVSKPVVFAANRLVVAVPATGSDITSVNDLAKPGVTLAIGSASVPIGIYTRQVLSGLGKGESSAILHNVRSNEPDVAGIVGKLTQGAVDAGMVYVTDVDATKGQLKAIDLPARLEPSVAYAAAEVKGTAHPQEAREFIDGLLTGAGQKALHAAGFLPPPK